MTVRQGFVIISIALLLLVATWGMYWPAAIWFYVPLLMLIVLGIHDMFQHSHTVYHKAMIENLWSYLPLSV